MRDLLEVCPLSRGTNNPYPLDYRTAFAFSSILYPQFYRLTSRLAFLGDEVA
jgi:hypothetical protein